MSKIVRTAVSALCALLAASEAHAQRGGGDWTTAGNDAQRSSWVRGDPKISTESMSKPGFQLVWKLKLKNEARQLNSLTPPALFDFYIGYRGFRTLGFLGGSSGAVIGIDTDLGRMEWERSFAAGSPSASSSILCPGGMTSSVTRPTSTPYPGIIAARGFGRGGPAKSGVGEPFEGAVTLKEQPVRFTPPPPPPATPGRRTAPPPNPFARGPQFVYAVTADGKLHSLYVSNGEEPNPPVEFLPPNANAQGLIVFDNTAYVATVNGCGGVENGVWAIDLQSKRVTRWKSPGGPAESLAFAAGPEGTLYVAAGNQLAALEPGTLKQKASYKSGEAFTSSPVVFEFKGKDLIAVAAGDGRMHLLDAAALSGQTPLFKSPVYSSGDFAAGALASWQDAAGVRWVLAPASGPAAAGAAFASSNGDVKNGAIAAWKVVEKNGAPALDAGWVSRDMVSPLAPAIVNGVVFALSSGEFRTSDPKVAAAQRAQRSSRAVLYALDPATGKQLWNSGNAITTFVHSGGLSAGGGRVYVGGHDGTQYAFGFPMEH